MWRKLPDFRAEKKASLAVMVVLVPDSCDTPYSAARNEAAS